MSNELIIKVETNQTNGMEVSELNLDGSNITIDWGDSTIDDYSDNIEHEYDEEGEYTITITGMSGILNGLLYGIRNVVEVIIPNNITSLPSNVFEACSNLEKVVLPNGISSIGSRFCYDCPNLVELNLPDGLENIGTYFLYMCGLDEVIFPYGISAIKPRTLNGSNVSNVVIPKSVTSIGDYAFQDCRNLSYIEIPNSVESIGALFGKGSSLTTIKFHSETPPTIGSNFLNGNDNCSIHIPEGSRDAYLNASNYPSDSARYVEYPTLKYKLETLGKLMASNLAKQFVSASWDEGLTTLANKIQDIELNNMTGFLADIGFYDQDSWNGTPPTILKDRIIFNDNAEFPFNNVVFPDTFTWSFILTTHDKRDELTEPILIGQYPSLNFEESVDMEFCIMITRENGGDFIIKCDETGDESSFNSLSSETLIITPYGTKPVTISGIYFSEEYDDYHYSTISYNLCWDNSFHTMSTDTWDNETDTKPTSVPLLLLKNGTPFKSYSLTEATDDLIFRGNSLVPVNYINSCWGNYHYIFSSDMSNYSWKTIKDIGCQLEFKDNREDLYFPIKHFKKGYTVDESNRLDNYFHNLIIDGYDEVNLQDYDILPWRDEHFDYQIVRKTPISLSSPELFFTFEYIRLDETNNDVGIFMEYAGPTVNDSLLFYISNDMFTISRNDTDICSSEKLVFQDYNIITICQYLSRDHTLLWEIELNGNSVLSYISNIFRQRVYTLQRQCYQNNAKISNFYYGSLDGV